MNKKNMLAIATLLIAVMAVASMANALKGGVKPLKGVYVSGGDDKLYVIDPDAMMVVTSKSIGQHELFPSNQYAGDKYYWIPGHGSQGLTVVNSKDLSVACVTGYGSDWAEVSPDGSVAYVTTLSTDTIIKVSADIDANGCPDTSNPLDKYVSDTSKHDGPCDMSISPDANWLCVPDIFSGITNGVGMDSITMYNANNLSDHVILYLPRCKDSAPMLSFMTTIDPYDNYPYCFVESFEALLGSNSGTESVIDISDPRNPVEIVRFVQDAVMADMANKCPNAVLAGDGNYYLSNGAQIKGGIGLTAYTDEFSKMRPGAKKYNFLNNQGSGDLTVIDVGTLEVVKTIALPAGSKAGSGDFSRDGSKYFVNGGANGLVCRIDVDTLSLDACVNIGVTALGPVVK